MMYNLLYALIRNDNQRIMSKQHTEIVQLLIIPLHKIMHLS